MEFIELWKLVGEDWNGWHFVRGVLYDPTNRSHTPASILAWFWLAQRLRFLRCDENERDRNLPDNVILLPSARPAHALTEELYRRIERGNKK